MYTYMCIDTTLFYNINSILLCICVCILPRLACFKTFYKETTTKLSHDLCHL